MKTVILASLALPLPAEQFRRTPLINARQNAQAHRTTTASIRDASASRKPENWCRVKPCAEPGKPGKADGFVTPLERARIHAAQNIQSARISSRSIIERLYGSEHAQRR